MEKGKKQKLEKERGVTQLTPLFSGSVCPLLDSILTKCCVRRAPYIERCAVDVEKKKEMKSPSPFPGS